MAGLHDGPWCAGASLVTGSKSADTARGGSSTSRPVIARRCACVCRHQGAVGLSGWLKSSSLYTMSGAPSLHPAQRAGSDRGGRCRQSVVDRPPHGLLESREVPRGSAPIPAAIRGSRLGGVVTSSCPKARETCWQVERRAAGPGFQAFQIDGSSANAVYGIIYSPSSGWSLPVAL
jgi:hypothetical protein